MIRVLHLVEDLKVGGLEKVIASIVLNVDKTKYDLSIWCVASGGAIADELIKKGVRVDVLNIKTYFNPFNVLTLAVKLHKAQSHIIHTHGYYAGTIGRLAGLLAGKRNFIHHVHSTYYGHSKRNMVVERMLGAFTNIIICCSQSVALHVHDSEKIPLSKTTVVYNGVPPGRPGDRDLEIVRTDLGIEPGDRVIVTVASLVENKGHRYLIEAMSKIVSDFPQAKLLVVGDGPARKQLEKQAAESSAAARIVFTGIRSDVPDLLAIADLFVLASCHREGLGISIIEAMAAGKPAIGTDLGGIPEVIVHNKTGLIVPPSDSTALAAAIKELLSNPDKAEVFARSGRQRYYDIFTEEKMIREIEHLYGRTIPA